MLYRDSSNKQNLSEIVFFFNLRRSKLRKIRIQPETKSNKSEEELIILSSRKTSTSTRPRSAPNDTKRTVSYGATESEIIRFHFYLRTGNENTFFSSSSLSLILFSYSSKPVPLQHLYAEMQVWQMSP